MTFRQQLKNLKATAARRTVILMCDIPLFCKSQVMNCPWAETCRTIAKNNYGNIQQDAL